MSNAPLNNSLFPVESQVLITGGNFISNVTQVHDSSKGGYERLLEHVAPSALHDADQVFEPARCHPGTRVKVIQDIMDWVDSVHDESKNKSLLWLSGAAGAGKTAIGRSICERASDEQKLLASFFFSSKDERRNHSGTLFATIAYQLSLHSSSIRQAISQFINHDPLIFDRVLKKQFEALVIEPLSAAYQYDSQQLERRLIVIDGLDECSDPKSRVKILDALNGVLTSTSSPIRVLVCSRPENEIVNHFSSHKTEEVTLKLFLGDEYGPREDIERYLLDSFNDIKRGHIFKHLLPDDWPHEGHVDKIVDKSSGQFIYAATTVRYVEDSRYQPHERLKVIVNLQTSFEDSPFAQLDTLYSHILSAGQSTDMNPDILAFPALYECHISPDMVEQIIGMRPGEVNVAFSHLGSIIQMSNLGARLLHKSFSDFLFDPKRSKTLYRNPTEANAWHILRVLQLFSEIRCDCRIKWSSLNSMDAIFSRYRDDDLSVLETDTYQATRDAIFNFPMQSFCRNIFAHDTECREYEFLPHFFVIFTNRTYRYDEILRKAYGFHVTSFCEAVIEQLNGKYLNDGECNYILGLHHLRDRTDSDNVRLEDTFTSILYLVSPHSIFSLYPIPLLRISQTFRRLLKKEEKSRIFSRAAAYCLENLLDQSRESRKDTKLLLHIGKMKIRIRQSYPWQWRWRRRAWNFYHANKSLVQWQYSKYKPWMTSRRWRIYSFSPHPLSISKAPSYFLTYLRGLIDLLPRAGRYPYLIELCKTRAFSPLYMIFPGLSRRARGEITKYLARMEYEETLQDRNDLSNRDDGHPEMEADKGVLNNRT